MAYSNWWCTVCSTKNDAAALRHEGMAGREAVYCYGCGAKHYVDYDVTLVIENLQVANTDGSDPADEDEDAGEDEEEEEDEDADDENSFTDECPGCSTVCSPCDDCGEPRCPDCHPDACWRCGNA